MFAPIWRLRAIGDSRGEAAHGEFQEEARREFWASEFYGDDGSGGAAPSASDKGRAADLAGHGPSPPRSSAPYGAQLKRWAEARSGGG